MRLLRGISTRWLVFLRAADAASLFKFDKKETCSSCSSPVAPNGRLSISQSRAVRWAAAGRGDSTNRSGINQSVLSWWPPRGLLLLELHYLYDSHWSFFFCLRFTNYSARHTRIAFTRHSRKRQKGKKEKEKKETSSL